LLNEGMTEHVLVFAGEPRREAARGELPADELCQPLLHPGTSARESTHAPRPEDLPEHARRAKDAPRLRGQRLEARLEHGEDRVGQHLASALGKGADDLLEVEGVARRTLEDELDLILGDAIAERFAYEDRSRAPRELAEAHLLKAALCPQLGEDFVDFGTR